MMCVCVYGVCKQNNVHIRRPSDGVRNNTRAHTYRYTMYAHIIQNAETESALSKVFFCLSFSLLLYPTGKQTINLYSLGGGWWWRRQLNSRRVNVWHYIQRPRWRKLRCVLSSSRIIIIIIIIITVVYITII